MQPPDLPHGTLDLLILKTLETMGALHGYALARRIEQLAGTTNRISQGSIYPALIRLEQDRLVATKWGLSETNRRVKFYSLKKAGAKRLAREVESWERSTALVAKFLEAKS
jgi:transcriptional regulator